MTNKFNPPPNWPQPPISWTPPRNWKPDPAWGPPPAGWELWVDSEDVRMGPTHAPNPSSAQRVFISYRRSDCQPQANGLHDGLTHRMTSTSIFMDIDSIPPGVDFEQHIRSEIEVCDVVLVLIGDNWLDARPGTGMRRIDEPDDFVRLEIESALASPRVRMIPVLVEGAQMPRAAELPESIRSLARINAIELSDQRWTSDLERLAEVVESIGREEQARAQRSSYEAGGADLPQEAPANSQPIAQPVVGQSQDVADGAGPARTSSVGWLMVALPILSCGFASFAPGLWAASRRRHDRQFLRLMLTFATVIGALSIVGFVLLVSAPTDAAGTPSGAQSDIGALTWLVAMAIATVVAVVHRKPAAQLPGTAQELARRRQRQQYRTLVDRDPALARSINVGRPDLPRDYSDGGLLDVNGLPAQELARFGPVSLEEARRIVEARQRVGRLSSVDELVVYANLSEVTASRLSEIAVFI